MFIISYSLSGRKNALEITRKIYGYTEFFNHSRYKYERKGILSNIPYEKISRGCFMIDPKSEKQVVSGLTKLGLKVKILHIKLLKKR